MASTAPTPEAIVRALSPHLPPGFGLVLFGSRAEGRAHARSDWDIGIVGRTPIDGSIVERLREALDELPTLHTFDVVDLATVPPEFRERALRHAKRIL